MTSCPEPGCEGEIEDGYCNVCGTAYAPPASAPAPRTAPSSQPAQSLPAQSPTAQSLPASSARPLSESRAGSSSAPGSGSQSTGSSTSFTSTRASRAGRTRSSRRSVPTIRRLGAGLVQVPEVPVPDPASLVQVNPQVPENKRFCGKCDKPAGRSRAGRPARPKGFCVNCQHPFSFEPGLRPGDEIGPYQVIGALAHGGQGWVYLARDRNVADNFLVVLKGLLDEGDADARAAAIAERRFLASVDHPAIVKIYTFVEHAGTGYTVMEYVGGTSLRELLKRRRAAAGKPHPLPVDEAISYLLAVLPAFAYLHRNGLVFCDFKPDNVMLGQDSLKLIDLGAVRHVDDTGGDVYGTSGFQAPEIGEHLPSPASDLYTLGRTLAALVLDFRGNTTTYKHSLPPPIDHPPLQRYDSLYRFIKKSTAVSPDDRFDSADEMHDELYGVLREVVAAERGVTVPTQSRRFTGDLHLTGEKLDGTRADPAWAVLPTLRVSPADPAASTLVALPDSDPRQLAELLSAMSPRTVEVRLRLARAYLEAGEYQAATTALDETEAEDPWDWRVSYYRGLLSLARDDVAAARTHFDDVYSEAPGELAPKLALALAAEVAGDLPYAGRMYETVSRTDDSFTSAAFGLARVRAAAGDRAGAAAAYRRVPPSSAAYVDAQLRLARLLGTATAAGVPSQAGLVEASGIWDRLVDLDPARKAGLARDLLAAAVGLVGAGTLPANDTVSVVGCALRGEALRFGLERAYRDLAKLASTTDARYALVDQANGVRPRTLT